MVFVEYPVLYKVLAVRWGLKGHDLAVVNSRLDTSISMVSFYQWINWFQATNEVVANPDTYLQKGPMTTLLPEHQEFILDCLDYDPCLYLDELQKRLLDQFNLTVSISTLSRELRQRLNLSRKKARTVHPNQCQQKRAEYAMEVSGIDPDCLVFVG